MFDRRREENLDGRDDVLEGPGFLYRPRQILLEIERSWSFDVVQTLHPRLADRVDYASADIENALTPQGYLALERGCWR
jgi:hypothetical protein